MSICEKNLPKADDGYHCHCEVCPYKTQVRKPYHYGDLYIIGRLWIEAMKTVLLGTKQSITNIDIVPTVCAAKPEDGEPSKPPLMRYSDLPLHETPHMNYNEHQNCLQSCPDVNRKLLQEYLLPKVSKKRQEIQESLCYIQKELKDTYIEVSTDVNQAIEDFKAYMRDPKQDAFKPAVVALGGITGYALASKRGVPGKLLFTTLGVLAGGFLCYPEETDEYLRTVLNVTAKTALEVYNKFSGDNLQIRGRLPCKSDLPPPVAKYAGQCIKKQ